MDLDYLFKRLKESAAKEYETVPSDVYVSITVDSDFDGTIEVSVSGRVEAEFVFVGFAELVELIANPQWCP